MSWWEIVLLVLAGVAGAVLLVYVLFVLYLRWAYRSFGADDNPEGDR